MKRRFVAVVSLWLAFTAPAAEDPSKVAVIDGVHYTGVAWGPIKDGKAMMVSDQGTRWIELDKLPERVARSYGLKGGNLNYAIPTNPLAPGGALTSPVTTLPMPKAGKTRIIEEEGWRVVTRFAGSGDMSTEPFEVATAPWRLRWQALGTSSSDDGYLHIVIFRPGQKDVVGRADGIPSGATHCYDAGAFYLQIRTSMTRYEMVVEERSPGERAGGASVPGPLPQPPPVPVVTRAPPIPGAAPAGPAMPEVPRRKRGVSSAVAEASRAESVPVPVSLTVARLGESEQEIAGKFGPSRKTMAGIGPGKTMFLYFRDGYSAGVQYQDGRAVGVTYSRVDEDVIPPPDLTTILKANDAGQRWDSVARRQLRRADGACAQLNEQGTVLTLSAPGCDSLQPATK